MAAMMMPRSSRRLAAAGSNGAFSVVVIVMAHKPFPFLGGLRYNAFGRAFGRDPPECVLPAALLPAGPRAFFVAVGPTGLVVHYLSLLRKHSSGDFLFLQKHDDGATIFRMRNKRGRPRKVASKAEHMQVRLDEAEKQAFAEAAALAGQSVSVWVRDQLRRAARQQLEEVGRTVPFLQASPSTRGAGVKKD
jgi:hypothetical protein